MFIQANYPVLRPLVDPWITEFLSNKKDIFKLVEAYGPSLEVHYPYLFLENHTALSSVFKKYSVRYKMLFPRKASKCKRIGKLASGNGIGAVVSSGEDLRQCLKEYDNQDHILVAPEILSDELIRLALIHNLCMVVQNVEDFEKIQKIGVQLNKSAKIGVRLDGFESTQTSKEPLKGITPNEAFSIISERFGKIWTQLDFFGFHFQIEKFCLHKKTEALRQTIVIMELLNRIGIKSKYIDIGDAFPVNYLADQKDWGNFLRELKKSNRYIGDLQSEQELNFDQMLNNNVLSEKGKMYPYYNKYPKEAFLEKLLLQPFSIHELLFQAIRSRGIQIIVQPGRALLDQTGVSLAGINSVQRNKNNEFEICVELNQHQLNKLKGDYLLDPIYISQENEFDHDFITGFLIADCDEGQEHILKRKIGFPKIPEVNDVICFVNTSGYAMHLKEVKPVITQNSKHIFISEAEKHWQYELEAS